jgi:lipopolysaccharide biosynthesis regulator YciM
MRARSFFPILCLVVLAASPAMAAGSRAGTVPRNPGDDAMMSFNDGVSARDRAWKLEKELASAKDAAAKTKLEAKILKAYQAAVRSQKNAVRYNPSLFQAYGELGYALRKTGDYAAALEAYDKALSIQPGYAEAIEYRAEAYLGLNRIDEARQAYMTLHNGGDATRAKMLADAMTKWLDQRRADPAGVAAEAIEEFAKWLTQRTEISRTAAGAGSWK